MVRRSRDCTAGAMEVNKASAKERYQQLCSSSRKKYEEVLNWDSWGRSFHQIAENIFTK